MQYFDLSHTKLDVFGAEYLAACVNNVGSLNINSCDFSAVMFDTLSQKVAKRTNPVRDLQVKIYSFLCQRKFLRKEAKCLTKPIASDR